MIPFERNPDRSGFRRRPWGEKGQGPGSDPRDGFGSASRGDPLDGDADGATRASEGRPDPASDGVRWGDRVREFPEPRGARGSEPAVARGSDATGTPPSARLDRRTAWLVPPLLLSAIAAGVVFVFRGPDEIFGVAFGLVLGLGILWILVSTLFPGRADRTCPRCGRSSLVRSDLDSTTGVECRACDWRDDTASSFLMAEEDGPLEDVVLRMRRSRGGRRF